MIALNNNHLTEKLLPSIRDIVGVQKPMLDDIRIFDKILYEIGKLQPLFKMASSRNNFTIFKTIDDNEYGQTSVLDSVDPIVGINLNGNSRDGNEVVETVKNDFDGSLDSKVNEKGEFLLRVDGGATVDNLLMQIQGDLLGNPVVRPVDIESTALGAAYASGLAVRIWTEDQKFSSSEMLKKAATFHPVV